MKKGILLFVLMFLLTSQTVAQVREIAITIDDLPLVASKMNTPANQQRSIDRFHHIMQALIENEVPATGFVIAGAIEKGQWAFLESFQKAGFTIGNHTYSHLNLNQTSSEKYIADVDKADKILTPLMGEDKYFRYPYLAEGGKEQKQAVFNYLAANHYVIAPVTIDSKDFAFNEQLYKVPFRLREQYTLTKMKPRYLAYIWQQTLRAEKLANGQPVKQILLIHANVLNSYLLQDIIKMYKGNGYTFISLSDALKNPAKKLTAPPAENNDEKGLQDVFAPV